MVSTCLMILGLATGTVADPTIQLAYLPPYTAINEALDSAPELEAARNDLRLAEAEARLLRRGEHELTVGASLDQRQIDRDGRFTEYSGQVSKGVRLPAKARVDQALAGLTYTLAQNRLEDARHQLSLELARRLTDVIDARQQLRLAQNDVATYQRDVSAMERRVALKDAARLDLEQLRSALAKAQAQVDAASGVMQLAEAALFSRFPSLVGKVQDYGAPSAPARPYEAWADLMIERSHELEIVRQEAERARLKARRAGLDRVADPVVGARMFSERGGLETGVGVFVSVPLGLNRREDVYQASLSSAASAEARLRLAEREARLMAQSDTLDVQSRLSSWARLSEASQAAKTAADTVEKGYRLGQISLSDALNARRQAQETERASQRAAKDAHMALLKLYLDAHELWLLEE